MYAALMKEMPLVFCHLGEGDIFGFSQASVYYEQTSVFLVFCQTRSTVAVLECEEMARRSRGGMPTAIKVN